MTKSEFLRKLKKETIANGWRWKVLQHGHVRVKIMGGKQTACPISVFGGLRASRWKEVAAQIGLSLEDSTDIVLAADDTLVVDRGRFISVNYALRHKLIKACGISGDGKPVNKRQPIAASRKH